MYPLILGGRVFDAAHLRLSGTSRLAAGWQAGVQFQPMHRLTLGLAYTSRLRQTFRQQQATLTPISSGEIQLDDALQTLLPARLYFNSQLDLPASLSAGVHFRPSAHLNVEIDLIWTGWQVFRGQQFQFDDSTFSVSRPADWRDVLALRAGLEYALSSALRYRLGYAFDPTPQPGNTVSPLWVDANRHLFSIGLGAPFGMLQIDTAVQLGFYQIRKIRGPNTFQFYGDYALFLFRTGLSVTYRF
ncbi:MAG: outer membrane protein transport protein [candidate division KSB1 bacterium]|nr:outer membrane protein transport protein [candidate division KSB1 bacterium]